MSILKSKFATAILCALAILWACTDPGNEARRQFIVRYVESINDDTDFYRQFTRDAEDELGVSLAKGRISRQFLVRSAHEMAPGVYEYSLDFSNGQHAIVTIREQDNAVFEATIFTSPDDRAL
jgi:hypothetical protein